MNVESLPALHRTFRDPSGSVEVRPDCVFRTVRRSHAADLLEFLRSPLATSLVASGRFVASEAIHVDGDLELRHPRIPFISYSWEWAPSFWLASAELTLSLCRELIEEGWILKDATPLNVLFECGRPVFVDVASVEKLDPNRSVWMAYGQFVRTFLLPMLAHSKLGWPLQLSQLRRDGIEPEDIYAALPLSRRFSRKMLTPVTLPILLNKVAGKKAVSRQGEAPGEALTRRFSDPEITKKILLRHLSALSKAMKGAMPKWRDSTWSNYAENAHHYSKDDHDEKRQFVRETLERHRPAAVLDVGCNTGAYSRIAAETGARVVSIDTDLGAVESLSRSLKGGTLNILPLCVDLAYPSPALGWENREGRSFLERAEGNFDMVLMLAVIHHLLLSAQIPMTEIARLVARITTRHLILEWVPPTDEKFVEVLRGRAAIYAHITEELCRASFGTYFHVQQEKRLSNGRTLFHMVRR